MGDLYFMPSDVARIVLGYLKESSYSRTYNCFLKECSHLKEIYNLEKAGRSLKKVTQYKLCKILEEWGHHKYSSENSTILGNNCIETPSSDDTVDDTLVCDNDVTNSGRKVNARSRSGAKKSPQVLIVRRSPCTPKSSRLRLKSPRNSNASNEQLARERENIVRTSDRLVSEHSNTGNLDEVTPKKSPLSNKRGDSSGKAVTFESPGPSGKGKDGKINDTEINTGAEVLTKSTPTPASNEDKAKTCYPETRQSQKDSEQSEKIGNNTNQESVNNDQFKDQLSDKQKEIVEDRLDVSEPKHRKTEETSNQLANTYENDKASTATKTITPETFVKTVPESQSNTITKNAANERCLAWLKRNDEVIKSREQCETNVKFEHSGPQNLDGSQNNTQPVQQGGDNTGTGHLAVKEQAAAHIDENSNATSKSSASTETVSSNSQGIIPGTVTSEKESNRLQTPQLPLHATPKKTSPEGREKNLVTPMKPLLSCDPHTNKSPRRKKPKTPRKRHSDVSPVSVVSVKSVDPGSVNPIFEKILADHRLHEKLAETCNLVHSQIRLANSGKENKSDTRVGEQISPVPTSHSYDQETVTASQSLEEILGLDHNFHADMLSDNIDMSDPAYSSLFKLFGTDRETFNEYLRKEKEKELALMEAEVEELERSNHEILCANFGVSNADAGYETQELAYGSPHHVALGSQDLFSTQHRSPRTLTTSTPCGNNIPVNFNPALRGGLGNSPVHSSNVFGGVNHPGIDDKISPSSTATQPFSPTHSNYNDVNNPSTSQNLQHLSTYVNGNSPRGPNSPGCHVEDPYSNPATPLQSNASHIMHSTPTGPGNPDHFHHSSPIHSQHSTVKNSHAPVHCSPLVKADIHPRSPLVSDTNGHYPNNNNSLYFHSQITNVNQNNNGFLQLLQNEVNIQPSLRAPCTTIENTIGCISLPQPQRNETKQNDNTKKNTSRSRRKKEPVKRKNVSASHATVKSLLEKPLKHLNTFPLSLKVGVLRQVCRTPEKRPENLTFRSPGGKTMINVPLLNCEDQIDLSVLGMDENIDAHASTVNVYDQKLDTSTQYSIAPENQATHDLVNAIEAGKSLEVIQQMNKIRSDESKPNTARRTNNERKTRPRKKKDETDKDEPKVRLSLTPPSSDQPVEGIVEPTQVFTATPFTDLHKAATVRALNFGPNTDDPEIAHYRKIYPKIQENSSSVLILNTSCTNQVITEGQNVIVKSMPVTLVNNLPKQSNLKVAMENDNLNATSEIGQGHSQLVDDKKKCDTVIRSDKRTPKKVQIKSPSKSKSMSDKTPRKLKQSPKQTRNLSKEMSEHTSDKGNDKKSVEKATVSKNGSDTIVKGSVESEVDIKTKTDVVKGKKMDNSSKTSKSKCNKPKEKLKVKIPSHKSPKGKKAHTKSPKMGIPFYFKKKNATPPENDSGSSGEDDMPLSVLRKRNLQEKKEEPKSVEIVIESESTEDEGGAENVIPAHSDSKGKFEEIDNTKKELLFEKIGLTPTKSLCKNDFKSPTRANALDVMAEWQRSPLSSRSRGLTPNTRNRFSKSIDALKSPTTPKRKTETLKSPATPKSKTDALKSPAIHKGKTDALKSPTTLMRRTPAKQLFASPIKETVATENVTRGRGKHTAKRVEKIIDRLKQNNPGVNLGSAKKHRDKKYSRNDTIKSDVNPEDSENVTEKITSDLMKKEKKSLKIENEQLHTPVNEEEILENKDESNVVNDNVVVDDKDFNNSVIENINEEANNENQLFVVDETSQGASELHRAVASIEFDQSDFHHGEEHSVTVHQYNEDQLSNIYSYSKDEEPLNKFGDTNVECTEISNTCDIENDMEEVTGQTCHSQENQFSGIVKGQTDEESVYRHQQLVEVEVHVLPSDQNSRDVMEELHKSDNNVEMRNEQTDNLLQNTCARTVPEMEKSESVVKTPEKVESSHDQSKVDSVNSDHSKRKSKKKRRKHRHYHGVSKGSGTEVINVGDQFVSPGVNVEGEHHRHSHKKKKKKSKKRHREESVDGHESKRRKKEEKNASFDSLSALNVDEALSQIYGAQSSN